MSQPPKGPVLIDLDDDGSATPSPCEAPPVPEPHLPPPEGAAMTTVALGLNSDRPIISHRAAWLLTSPPVAQTSSAGTISPGSPAIRTWHSGSPNRALNSTTFGPDGVTMIPT